MSLENGYIKLWRDLLKKPIWIKSTPEQRSVLISILLLANHSTTEWEWMGEKFKVNPGQFISSLESIRTKSGKGTSTQNVRSSLKRFQKLDFLTDYPTKTGRLITIINWGSYQPEKINPTKEATKTQQRPNKDPTPNKNVRTKEEEIYSRVTKYLNAKTGKNYKEDSKVMVKFLGLRLKDGFSPENFKTVIDNKTAQWLNDPENEKYLRPETLFGSKFESYLNEKPVNGSKLSTKETMEKHGL